MEIQVQIVLEHQIDREQSPICQLELLSEPPESENKALTWPDWPMKLRTSTSHQEGCNENGRYY